MKQLATALGFSLMSVFAIAQVSPDIGFETKITGNIYNSSCSLSTLDYQSLGGAAFGRESNVVKVGLLHFNFDCNKEQVFKAYPEIAEGGSNTYKVFFKDEQSGKLINPESKMTFDDDSRQRSLGVYVEFTEDFGGDFDELVTLVIELN